MPVTSSSSAARRTIQNILAASVSGSLYNTLRAQRVLTGQSKNKIIIPSKLHTTYYWETLRKHACTCSEMRSKGPRIFCVIRGHEADRINGVAR